MSELLPKEITLYIMRSRVSPEERKARLEAAHSKLDKLFQGNKVAIYVTYVLSREYRAMCEVNGETITYNGDTKEESFSAPKLMMASAYKAHENWQRPQPNRGPLLKKPVKIDRSEKPTSADYDIWGEF